MRSLRRTNLSGFSRKIEDFTSGPVDVLRDLIRDISNSYRREQHYMRGPGPKWRAKHQRIADDDSEVFDIKLARARIHRK